MELPVDARLRELWKAVAITTCEHEAAERAIEKADVVTMAFIRRFMPENDIAATIKRQIRSENSTIGE